MSRDENVTEYVDTETGEVLTGEVITGPGSGTVVIPTQVTKGSEVARFPETFAELADFFTQDEPSPMEVARWIFEPDQMEERDPEESARAILARIFAADTAEEILATREVTHAQDILNEAINIQSVKWQRSDFQQGSSCYAVVTATRVTDDSPVTITCGGRNVMGQLLKLSMNGHLPRRAAITQSAKPTARGYKPLWLEPR